MRALACLLALLWTGPVLAQSSEPFFGCPAGQTIETAPDPRPNPSPARGIAPRLVVRCVGTGPFPSRPQCPPGQRPVAMLGTDPCGPDSGGVTDGTSNTVMVGETGTPNDGTSNTLNGGETAGGVRMGDGSFRVIASTPPTPGAGLTTGKGSGTISAAPTTGAAPIVPRCTAPAHLAIDANGAPADLCITRSFGPPTAAVAVPSR